MGDLEVPAFSIRFFVMIRVKHDLGLNEQVYSRTQEWKHPSVPMVGDTVHVAVVRTDTNPPMGAEAQVDVGSRTWFADGGDGVLIYLTPIARSGVG